MWSIHTSKCWRGLGGGGGIGGPRQPAVTITRGSGWHTAGAIVVLLHTAQLPYICLTPTIHTSLMVAQPNDILVHGGQLYSGNLWGMPLLCCWFVGSCKLYFTNWLHYNSTACTLPHGQSTLHHGSCNECDDFSRLSLMNWISNRFSYYHRQGWQLSWETLLKV